MATGQLHITEQGWKIQGIVIDVGLYFKPFAVGLFHYCLVFLMYAANVEFYRYPFLRLFSGFVSYFILDTNRPEPAMLVNLRHFMIFLAKGEI